MPPLPDLGSAPPSQRLSLIREHVERCEKEGQRIPPAVRDYLMDEIIKAQVEVTREREQQAR